MPLLSKYLPVLRAPGFNEPYDIRPYKSALLLFKKSEFGANFWGTNYTSFHLKMPFASLEYQTHTKCLYFPSPSPPLSSIEFSFLMVQIFAGAAFDFGAFDCASFPLFQNLWRVLSKKEVKVWDPTHSTVSDWWFWNIATVGFVSSDSKEYQIKKKERGDNVQTCMCGWGSNYSAYFQG